jgi:hypothetical protein
MLESKFQADLIKDIEFMFEGCIVLKNDANYIQGFPDLTILYKDKWAVLECKKYQGARQQPNQSYYVDMCNQMSFSRFVWPGNKQEVLDELQQAFSSGRSTRLLKR